MDGSGTSRTVRDDMRYERNRFVAFAFAAADAFLETDEALSVTYATGAVRSIIGAEDSAAIGSHLPDLLVPQDRARFRAFADLARSTGRAGPNEFTLMRLGGPGPRLEVNASFLPARGGRLFFTFRIPDGDGNATGRLRAGTEVGGLLNAEDFASVACELATGARDDSTAGHMNMTLVEIAGLSDLEARLDPEHAQRLMEDIAGQLQVLAVEGAAAGRLAGDRYGILHRADADIGRLERTIADKTRASDPEGKGAAVGAHSLDLEPESLSETELAKALIYTINRFSEARGEFTIGDLTTGYRAMMDETRDRIAVFKSVIANGQFEIAFQPIVDLASLDVHHFEALVRLQRGVTTSSPYQFITFAEETGIIPDFDLAMCRRAIGDLQACDRKGVQHAVAVNLSGRSLSSSSFVKTLLDLLKGFGELRDRLHFEVTESSRIEDLDGTNRILQELRSLGHSICLDDFGAGASAFQYLRVLEVDYVKIDGLYVQESCRSAKGMAFLRSMAGLCHDLGIRTVGEMVETDEMAGHLRTLGVDYGQGYLFGKPMPKLPMPEPKKVRLIGPRPGA